MIRAVDGDTFYVILDLGFGIMFGNERAPQRLRLADYNAPEKNAEDEEVRAKAMEAMKFVAQFEGQEVQVRTRKTRKGKERQTFGRYVADVAVSWELQPGKIRWVDLAELMMDKGLVERWIG
jgi:endonuclease YncB( thermonuclease family)